MQDLRLLQLLIAARAATGLLTGFIGNIFKIKCVGVSGIGGAADEPLHAVLFLRTNAVRRICPIGKMVPAYRFDDPHAGVTH